MEHRLKTPDDQPEKSERTDSIAEQLSFTARFVLIFGEINHSLARATCERLLALA